MTWDHLTRLLQERQSLTVETPGGVEMDAWVEAMDHPRHRLTLRLRHPSPPISPGDALRMAFTFAGQRWMATAQLHHYPDRSTYVSSLPRRFEAADRRTHARWAVPPPGGRVEVRVSLGEGLVFRGPLESLCEGGLSLRVEELLGAEGPVPWREGLLQEGHAFEAVLLRELEGLPDLEAEGRLAWAGELNGGLRLGLRLRGLTESSRESLRAFLAPRLQPLPEALPPAPSSGLAQPEGDGPPAPDRSQALLRLKKRGRTVVVAMKPGLVREAVVDFMVKDGFGKVFTVDTLGQWLELSATKNVDLVFIDGGVKELHDLELASFLHQSRGHQAFAIVLAISTLGTSLGLLTKKAGVNHLLSKPYTLDVSLTQALELALDLRTQEGPPPVASHQGLLKRKPLALAMPPSPEREALQAFLLGEGFARVLPAGTLGELIRTLHSPTLGLIFVDWEEPSLSGLEVASFLAGRSEDARFALVLACTQAGPRLIREATELGVAKVILKPYELKGPLVETLLKALESKATES